MSDKQNKESSLVNQEDALDFYFDSLLLSEENDMFGNDDVQGKNEKNNIEELSSLNATIKSNQLETQELKKPEDELQSAKDFLQASKLRQGIQKETRLKVPESQSSVVALNSEINSGNIESDSRKIDPPIKIKQTIETEFSKKNPQKTITSGPVSPKPRIQHHKITKKLIPATSEIIFSTKNNDGEITEQVLIPRSQRLATATKKIEVDEVLKHKRFVVTNKPLANENPIEPGPSETSKASIRATQAVSKEAPSIDLSLFLPKIKTLTEEEIAQQIEALTEAAVSQAQVESDRAHVAELEQVSQNLIKVQAESSGPTRNIENAPSWAVPDFQVLLFMVSGLKLAVPLTELNGILEWGDEYITELPGHKPWYLGIIQNQGKNVPVIDTLQQVVPRNRWPENHLKEKNFKHIIMIDNAKWGLACEKVLEVITLKTDAVKWRSSRTKRRWLLGTVIDHMCALLDSSEFAAMLQTGDDSLID